MGMMNFAKRFIYPIITKLRIASYTISKDGAIMDKDANFFTLKNQTVKDLFLNIRITLINFMNYLSQLNLNLTMISIRLLNYLQRKTTKVNQSVQLVLKKLQVSHKYINKINTKDLKN